MTRENSVVSGWARLPSQLGDAQKALLLEIGFDLELGTCEACALSPDYALTRGLVEDTLVGRHMSELPEVANEVKARCLGPLQRPLVAAILNAWSNWSRFNESRRSSGSAK